MESLYPRHLSVGGNVTEAAGGGNKKLTFQQTAPKTQGEYPSAASKAAVTRANGAILSRPYGISTQPDKIVSTLLFFADVTEQRTG